MHGTSRQVLPSYLEVRRALTAFSAAAEEKELSRRRRQIYRSWILGFLCWCSARPPHRASPDRMRPFLRSIRHHPDSEPTHEAQVTEALNFLFEAVWPHAEEDLSLFRSGIIRSEDASSPPKPEASTPGTGGERESAAESKGGPSQKNGEPSPSTGPSSVGPSSARSFSKKKHGSLHLSLSEEQARRLRQVAGHLELPPELVAERAIDMICREAGTPQGDPPTKERSLSTGTLLYQNLARVDLLSQRDDPGAPSTSEASNETSATGTNKASASKNGRKENGVRKDDTAGDVLREPDAALVRFR